MSEVPPELTDEQNGPPVLASRRGFLTGALTIGTAAGGLARATPAQGHTTNQGDDHVNPRLFNFIGGNAGTWSVVSNKTITGEPLPEVDYVEIVSGLVSTLPGTGKWLLRGVTSNSRYVTRDEKAALAAVQAPLGRPEATHAALIPIRKNDAWWSLTQDERRDIFEERSHHTAVGLKYLPAIARRLHHCRDLGETEPFDFLTQFDFQPTDAGAFNDLLAALRSTEEWKFVDREVELRLVKAS
jgi:hypothetical protein